MRILLNATIASLAIWLMAGEAMSQPGSGSSHVEWAGAPVACLPGRAQRWDSASEMQPCHCPPQSYCPPPIETLIGPEHIDLYVSINGSSFSVNGADLGSSLQEVFSVDFNALVRSRYNCYEGCSGTATWIINYVPDVLNDWANNTLRLPVSLASRCCDNLCPSNMVPTFKTETIAKPRDPDEGIQMSKQDMEGLIDDLDDLKSDLKAKGGLNTQVTDTNSVMESIENYIGSGNPVDLDLLNALADAVDTFDTSINKPVVPASIKTDHEETIAKTDALATQVAQEINLLTLPPEMIEVTTFSCSSSSTFELPREGCLVAGTQITLADGTKKAIEALTIDDKVKGNHGAAKIIAMSKFTQRTEQMYSINGGRAFFTVEHPVLTPKGWKSVDATITSIKSGIQMAGTLRVGDVILLEDGKDLKVESIEKVEVTGGIPAYNLSVEGDGSFIANGFIMKGFKKMQMHY